MFDMTLPDPGEGLLEAEVVSWLVSVGDEVAVNDVLIEVETAKSVVELPAPVAGVVAELLVQSGDVVPVGSVIARIDNGSTDAAAGEGGDTESLLVGYGASEGRVTRRARKGSAAEPTPEGGQFNDSYALDDTPGHRTEEVQATRPVVDRTREPELPAPSEPDRDDEGAGTETDRAAEAEAPTDPAGRPLAKPAVRRLARDLGLDLASITGTGPQGSITPTDVVHAAADEASGRRRTTRIPLRGVRRQMLTSMQASVQVPQASVWMDVDVTNTVALIEQLKKRREFADLRISPIIVLAKAVCLALQRHPEVNSSLDLEREEIVVHPEVNLGVAAATQRGLIVPNIKGAEAMNLLELAQALNELVQKVREGRITPRDAAQGTFTITNVGVFGVEGGTPILNPNESAILLLGTFNRRPWVVGDGSGERIEIRSVAKLTLTIDHRVLDGEQASRFLADVAEILTDPGLSLLY